MPAAAEDVALMVSVALWPLLMLLGLKLAVTPDGAPDVERDTVWAVPAVMAVAMLTAPALPAATLSAAGLALREKSLLIEDEIVSATVAE